MKTVGDTTTSTFPLSHNALCPVEDKFGFLQSNAICKVQMLSILTSLKVLSSVGTLPNDKFLDLSKLKAFADDTFNVATMMISVIIG